MSASITLRSGLDKASSLTIMGSTPTADPDRWLRRAEVAEQLGIDIRTVDRYLRERTLSSYTGPVPGRQYGVRVWADDLDLLRPETVAEVRK